jgi:hypothetical protein
MPHDLGLEITSFDNIGMSAATFYRKLHRKSIKNKKFQMKNIKLTDMNKKDSLMMHIVNILKMMKIKLKGSLMTIAKILQIS